MKTKLSKSTMSETPHEADLIKSAELLMRVIPAEARVDIMRGYCRSCGSAAPKAQKQSENELIIVETRNQRGNEM